MWIRSRAHKDLLDKIHRLEQHKKLLQLNNKGLRYERDLLKETIQFLEGINDVVSTSVHKKAEEST